ncbi:MAG: RES family NAD+ phosphorylase [Steroidobacteraceae bacterium]
MRSIWHSPSSSETRNATARTFCALRRPDDWIVTRWRIDDPFIEIADSLPEDWRQRPAPPSARELGSRWVAESRSVVLRVPSIVVDGEFNYLLNPRHPDFARLEIGAPRAPSPSIRV